MNHIGQNIKRLRQKQQWSQGQAAKQLSISIPAFSKIETGITDINISRLEQIASLFDVSLWEILSRSGDNLGSLHSEELNKLKDKLAEKEQEVIKLQTKMIALYDELRANNLILSRT